MSSVESATWEALKAAGALKEGHFLLSSGKHSDKYLEKFDLLRNPRETEKACAGFAERFRDAAIDVVVGPTTGGVILAFETGRQLGTAAAYAEPGLRIHCNGLTASADPTTAVRARKLRRDKPFFRPNRDVTRATTRSSSVCVM